jgi:tRNA(fMet)-specific endonuclease VapC
MTYLIDTNIIIDFLRDGELSKQLFNNWKWLSGEDTIALSIVSVGEAKSLARQNRWGASKMRKLQYILADLVIIPIHGEDIIEAYAEIDAYSQGKHPEKPLPKGITARNMGKNDLWIAATAHVLGAKFFTTDKDFTHLKDTFLDIHIADWQQFYE